jgi:hypothetical protein
MSSVKELAETTVSMLNKEIADAAGLPELSNAQARGPELSYDMIRDQMRQIEFMSPFRTDREITRADESLRAELAHLDGVFRDVVRATPPWEQERPVRDYDERRNAIMRERMRLTVQRPMLIPRNGFDFVTGLSLLTPSSFAPPVPPMPAEPQKTGLATITGDPSELEFLREYHRVASKVGFACKEVRVKVTEAELVDWLQGQAMPVYDYGQVKGYLDGIVSRYNAEHYPSSRVDWKWVPVAQYGKLDKPIPMPVLMTMEKVADRFGDSVEMSISEITKYPDPFLSLHVPGSERRFVIERWDEPKFRDKA